MKCAATLMSARMTRTWIAADATWKTPKPAIHASARITPTTTTWGTPSVSVSTQAPVPGADGRAVRVDLQPRHPEAQRQRRPRPDDGYNWRRGGPGRRSTTCRGQGHVPAPEESQRVAGGPSPLGAAGTSPSTKWISARPSAGQPARCVRQAARVVSSVRVTRCWPETPQAIMYARTASARDCASLGARASAPSAYPNDSELRRVHL